VPAEELWRAKRAAQARDIGHASRQDLSSGERLLLSPEEIHSAKAKWPKAKLSLSAVEIRKNALNTPVARKQRAPRPLGRKSAR
jgi:hypothetical protein